MNNFQVYLSPLASFKLDLLFQYLEQEWGTEVKNSFLNKFRNTIDQLSIHPQSFPESKEIEGIRKCVVTSQTSLYYRIQSETVEIITVIDNRQDSEKISNEISTYFGEA